MKHTFQFSCFPHGKGLNARIDIWGKHKIVVIPEVKDGELGIATLKVLEHFKSFVESNGENRNMI